MKLNRFRDRKDSSKGFAINRRTTNNNAVLLDDLSAATDQDHIKRRSPYLTKDQGTESATKTGG